MTIVPDTSMPPCIEAPELFQDERLSDPQNDSTEQERASIEAIRASAHRQCASCSVLTDCLYRAVVLTDVAGFVACTTEPDRRKMRRILGLKVSPPTTTPFGIPRSGRAVSHESVMEARLAFPTDTSSQLAVRLGCSTSTIKRHLRRARERRAVVVAPSPVMPTMDQVLDAFDQLETSQVA